MSPAFLVVVVLVVSVDATFNFGPFQWLRDDSVFLSSPASTSADDFTTQLNVSFTTTTIPTTTTTHGPLAAVSPPENPYMLEIYRRPAGPKSYLFVYPSKGNGSRFPLKYGMVSSRNGYHSTIDEHSTETSLPSSSVRPGVFSFLRPWVYGLAQRIPVSTPTSMPTLPLQTSRTPTSGFIVVERTTPSPLQAASTSRTASDAPTISLREGQQNASASTRFVEGRSTFGGTSTTASSSDVTSIAPSHDLRTAATENRLLTAPVSLKMTVVTESIATPTPEVVSTTPTIPLTTTADANHRPAFMSGYQNVGLDNLTMEVGQMNDPLLQPFQEPDGSYSFVVADGRRGEIDNQTASLTLDVPNVTLSSPTAQGNISVLAGLLELLRPWIYGTQSTEEGFSTTGISTSRAFTTETPLPPDATVRSPDATAVGSLTGLPAPRSNPVTTPAVTTTDTFALPDVINATRRNYVDAGLPATTFPTAGPRAQFDLTATSQPESTAASAPAYYLSSDSVVPVETSTALPTTVAHSTASGVPHTRSGKVTTTAAPLTDKDTTLLATVAVRSAGVGVTVTPIVPVNATGTATVPATTPQSAVPVTTVPPFLLLSTATPVAPEALPELASLPNLIQEMQGDSTVPADTADGFKYRHFYDASELMQLL